MAFVVDKVTLGRAFLLTFQYYSTSAKFAALLNKGALVYLLSATYSCKIIQ